MTWSRKKAEIFKKIAVTASILTALILCIIKTIASLMTGSIAVLSSLIDSLSDVVASLISYIAVKFSLKPASCTHRYGYFKAEAISALAQAAFIAGSGLFVMYNGIERVLNPTALKQTNIGIFIMLISLVLSLGLIMFQKFVLKNTSSIAIKADSVHYTVDILTNSATLLSLYIVQKFHIQIIDVITAFFIAMYLLYYAFDIAKEATDYLMDKELPLEVKKNIIQIIRKTKRIKGLHDFRSRNLGGIYYFELHLEMDGSLTLNEAHHLSDLVEKKIKALYPDAQVLIHQDPFGIKEARLDESLKNCGF